MGSAINKGQDARIKLRSVLAKYNAVDYEVPDYSTKKKAQKLAGLSYAKMVKDKLNFKSGLRQEWVKKSKDKGLYDPKAREGMEFKTSYSQ